MFCIVYLATFCKFDSTFLDVTIFFEINFSAVHPWVILEPGTGRRNGPFGGQKQIFHHATVLDYSLRLTPMHLFITITFLQLQ